MPTIAFLLIFLILATFAYAGVSGAPWVPTWKSDVDRFIGIADILPGQVMVDLGCGDGRLVFAAARVGADARGYEISLLPYLLARLRAPFARGKGRASIFFRDLWKTDLRDVDVVYFFLMPDKIDRLKEKLMRELKPGAKVISYVWPIKGWNADRELIEEGHTSLYLYTKK